MEPGIDAMALAADGALSVAEAAKFLGISRAEIYERMRDGEIPFLHAGRRRLLPRRGLVAFLARQIEERAA